MLEKLRQIFLGPGIPPEARKAFEQAATYRELLQALDRVCTVNEVKLRELERDVASLEAVEKSEIEALKVETLTERQKKLALQRIQRLRRQIQLLDDKIDIHSKNINLHQSLMGKIQRIESMNMQAVDEELITELFSDFKEQFTKYKDVVLAGEAADAEPQSPLTESDRQELRKLEQELLGPTTPPVKQPLTTTPALEQTKTPAKANRDINVDLDADVELE